MPGHLENINGRKRNEGKYLSCCGPGGRHGIVARGGIGHADPGADDLHGCGLSDGIDRRRGLPFQPKDKGRRTGQPCGLEGPGPEDGDHDAGADGP